MEELRRSNSPETHPNQAPTATDQYRRPECLDLVEEALCRYKQHSETEYPNVSSLYEGAKNLWEEIEFHLTRGKQRLNRGEWTAKELKWDLIHLQQRHEPIWIKMEAATDVLRMELETSYQELLDAIGEVKHACGEVGLHAAWMHMPTPEQAMIRKVYALQLRTTWDEAKQDHFAMCGYPDGMVTQVKLLHKRCQNETAQVLSQLEHAVHHS